MTATVKITPRNTFSIKNDSKVTWAKYEISDNFVFFSTPVNTTPNSRNCIFILLDGEGNPVDTLKLTQLGKSSSTASMESHFVKLEPPYQIIHYGGVVGIQIGTLIVVGENSFEPKSIDIYTRSHPVVSYVDKRQLRAKLGKERGNRDIASYYGGGEGNVWSKVEISDVDVIGMSDLNADGEPSLFEWTDFVSLVNDGVALRDAENGLWRPNGIFDLENYLRRVGLYLKLPPVADHLVLELSLLCRKDEAWLH